MGNKVKTLWVRFLVLIVPLAIGFLAFQVMSLTLKTEILRDKQEIKQEISRMSREMIDMLGHHIT